MKEQLQEKIATFWEWFLLEQTRIEDLISERELVHRDRIVEKFDEHLLGMGQIKWVLEEKQTNQFSLTFSPNSSSELYQLTRALVGSAPIDLFNWHFYDAIQSTDEMDLLVYDQNMDTLSFDLTNWEASLKKEPNGKYFIEVNMHQYVEDEDLETVVVDLALNAILGEGPKLQILSGFDISSELDGPSKPFAAQCAFLKNEMR